MTLNVSPPPDAIELRTLGSLDLRTAEGFELRSALAQGKRIALLSYLAIAQPRGFHRRDTLVGMFWPEADQRRARAALRQALHFLRQALGRDVVLNRGPEEIGVDFDMLRCDVVEFEAYIERGETENAIALYGGPLLNGFFISDAPEFEKWLGIERDRLSALYGGALRSLAEDAAAGGNWTSAARWWKQLAVHDPYSSEVAMRLVGCLEASGDRAAAVAHAQSHNDILRYELEVEPDAQVLELIERLKTQPPRESRPSPPQPRPATEDAAQNWDSQTESTSPEPASFWTRTRLVSSAAIVLALCAVSVFLLTRTMASASVGKPAISLAVLPFENLGPPADDYFVLGLAEDLVGRLAGVQRLSLVGPNRGALNAPGEPGGFASAALNADYLLRGSVERVPSEGGRVLVRVLPNITRVADGRRVWSDVFEADLSQIFSGQIWIVQQVVHALGIDPLASETAWLRTTPTRDPAAYDLFLLGNHNLRSASTSLAAARNAVDYYERATSLDSLFVQAHAKLSIAHTSMFWWGHDHTPERLVAAKAAADQAVRLRPDSPNSHVALGWYYYWGEHDYDRALRHFELARTNWPGVCEVLVLVAAIRRRQGDFERALVEHYEAAEVDPSCATCFAGAAFTHLMLREFDDAARDVQRALDLAPTYSYARLVGALNRMNANGDTAGTREILGPPEDGLQLIRVGTRHWSAIPRILGGDWEELLAGLSLSSNLADTAGYYLLKADLASRRERPAEAEAYYDSARVNLEKHKSEILDDPHLRSRLGLAYAGLGRYEDALREGVYATRLRPISVDAVNGPLAIEMLARIYALLGDHEAAIDQLEVLLSTPSHVSTQTIRLDPVWMPLRERTRFRQLLR